MHKSLTTLLLMTGLLSTASAVDNLYVGLQASSPSTGISIKKDLNRQVALQGIFDILGDKTSYSARGIYKFDNDPFWELYAFGECGLWSWDRNYHHNEDETTVGFGLGLGVEYDMRKLAVNFPPLFVSLELNYYSIDFDESYYYDDDDDFGLGFGIHYKF